MQPADGTRLYSRPARLFHWVTFGFVAVMVPVGIIMTDRGERNIWDATTNGLYSGHKLAGFILMFIVAARLIYRLAKGAPPPEPTLTPLQKTVSGLTHWGMYLLLFGMFATGWLGISLYPALDIFGLFSLPAITGPNEAAAGRVLTAHKLVAFALMGLIGMHVAAALYHGLIRKDGVLRRMWPARS